jgi:YidC/Oxa1 family membrane protein insertase
MFDPFFQAAAWLIDTFYGWVHEYTIAIAMVSVAIMTLITPLTLKSTKGMLEMQRLQPEMRRLQNQYKGDRVQLNQEMMKLYQEHKVNPLASCLPLLAQMPVFIIMFQVLNGLTRLGADNTFDPKYISENTDLYQSLDKTNEMLSFGLNLALTPAEAMGENFVKGRPGPRSPGGKCPGTRDGQGRCRLGQEGQAEVRTHPGRPAHSEQAGDPQQEPAHAEQPTHPTRSPVEAQQGMTTHIAVI